MSGAESRPAGDDAQDIDIANWTRVRDPRRLTEAEIEAGRREEGGKVTDAYYAILRADGYVGEECGSHTPSPKIRLLFVTADGRKSLTRKHRAVEVDNGDRWHEFEGQQPVVLQRLPDEGFPTSPSSIQPYGRLAQDLYDLDAEEVSR